MYLHSLVIFLGTPVHLKRSQFYYMFITEAIVGGGVVQEYYGTMVAKTLETPLILCNALSAYLYLTQQNWKWLSKRWMTSKD